MRSRIWRKIMNNRMNWKKTKTKLGDSFDLYWSDRCCPGRLAVLPLLSPFGRSLSIQEQLGQIDVLVNMRITQCWTLVVIFNEEQNKCSCNYTPEANRVSTVALSRYRQKYWWLGGCGGHLILWYKCRWVCWYDPTYYVRPSLLESTSLLFK